MTELDELSNRVIALLEAGDFHEAEATCHRLQEQYPDQVDGLWRLAMVYERRGDRAAAAKSYRDTAEFMRTHEGFDEQSITHMMDSAVRLEAEPGRVQGGS